MSRQSLIYQKNSVESLSPGRVILLLFNACLQSLAKIRETLGLEFSVRNQEILHNNVQKIERILRELQGCLNFKPAKELADTLFRLYDYACDQLAIVRSKKTIENLNNVERVLKELRDGWAEMLQKREAEKNN